MALSLEGLEAGCVAEESGKGASGWAGSRAP